MDSFPILTQTAIRQRAAPGLRETAVRSASGRPDRLFDSVLCFGDSDWWYHNRGHADMQFMRRFARDLKVIYVNSLGVAAPRLLEGRTFARRVLRKARSVARFYGDSGECFAVLSPVYWPAVRGVAGRALVQALAAQIRLVLALRKMHRPLLWVTCPTAALVLPLIGRAATVYQLSDGYVALEGGRADHIAPLERRLADSADLVICSSLALRDHCRAHYGCGEYVDHGVDYAYFAEAESSAIPSELSKAPRPIVGFFGNIDGNTVDRELLDAVIQARPRYTFALVGPMADSFRPLCRHRNVVSIPQQPYSRIARYGAAFDVCIMPWLQNEWIAHCNPVKLKEYLALGKPVVSTPFPELRRNGAPCLVARGAAAFAEAIDRAITGDNPHDQQLRKRWASAHTWDAKHWLVMDMLAERGIHPCKP